MLRVARNPLERLQGLVVADIMTRDVTVIPETACMVEAAATLSLGGASGAPVVDCCGRCIGVLSATDFMRVDKNAAWGPSYPTEDNGLGLGELPRISVKRFMTAPVQTVSPNEPMMHAVELMCGKHIHRLVVVDDRERPVGLVSTLDVVAALLHAVDEDRLTAHTSAL